MPGMGKKKCHNLKPRGGVQIIKSIRDVQNANILFKKEKRKRKKSSQRLWGVGQLCPWALPSYVVLGPASGELRSADGIVSGEKDVFSI